MAQPFVERCASGIIEAGAGSATARNREDPPAQTDAPFSLHDCVVDGFHRWVSAHCRTPQIAFLISAPISLPFNGFSILNRYVLALASLTLAGGVLADVHGKRRVLSINCLAFGIALK